MFIRVGQRDNDNALHVHCHGERSEPSHRTIDAGTPNFNQLLHIVQHDNNSMA
jgi:hypothetical protein